MDFSVTREQVRQPIYHRGALVARTAPITARLLVGPAHGARAPNKSRGGSRSRGRGMTTGAGLPSRFRAGAGSLHLGPGARPPRLRKGRIGLSPALTNVN